jgi:nucleotide-binding universal stress UspA family protein
MIERLLVPLEEGALGEHAFATGIDLARQLGAAMIGLVVEPFNAVPHGDLAMQQHASRLIEPLQRRAAHAGVPFRGIVSQASDISEAIVAEAEEQHADMILMVTHGRGAIGEFLWGANTRRVTARTRLPVMVLRLPAAPLHSGPPASDDDAASRDRIAA